jgi:uncharacterized membrane protein YdjX (TVP38/TMEM64 family)
MKSGSESSGESRAAGKEKTRWKLALIALIAVMVGLFYFLGLGEYLNLAYIQRSREAFQAIHESRPLLVSALYMGLYVLVTALSLPGATVLTLAGGYLFGFIAGTVLVSFASTLGAALACFFARFLLRDWVEGRFGEKLAVVNRGIEREGSFYLFTLRLIPVFPFFMINLVMGLTKMPLWTFCWVSQAGMLPGTMVYVNAGKELGKIESLSGILSPTLILSFAVLGLFPITVKKLMAWYRPRFRNAGSGKEKRGP